MTGLNKWELILENNGASRWAERLICAKGTNEIIYCPFSQGSVPWFYWYFIQFLIFGFAPYKLYFEGNFYYLTIMSAVAFFYTLLCCNEFILFGDINARWFVSYPKIVLNSKGVEYSRVKKTTFIPWKEIVCLRDRTVGGLLFKGITLISKEGKKFTFPVIHVSKEFYFILINTVIERSELIIVDKPSNWLKKLILGTKWNKV